MEMPADLRYSSDHEWARVADGTARIGITDYAQDALGDVVYVEVPELGATVSAGDKISEVESTKSVSDIYAPVGGVIAAVIEDLADSPELINSDPYNDGWLFTITPNDIEDVEKLLDAAGYEESITE